MVYFVKMYPNFSLHSNSLTSYQKIASECSFECKKLSSSASLSNSTTVNTLKYISYNMVQSFRQVDPIILLVLFKNLHISCCFFTITVLVFHNIDKKLPYFSYFEQKVNKLSFYKDDQKPRKNGSTC